MLVKASQHVPIYRLPVIHPVSSKVRHFSTFFAHFGLHWLVLINVVTLRRAQLVLGWVTVRGYTILVFNQSHPGLLNLAIPP